MINDTTWITPESKAQYVKCNYFMVTSPPGEPLHEAPEKTRKIIARYKRVAANWTEGNEISPVTGQEHTHLLIMLPTATYVDINELETWHFDVIPAEDLERANDYCKKDGNYTCKNEILPAQYADPAPRWRPWQQMVLDEITDERTVICIYDKVGNTGKTYLSHWFAARHQAAIIPIMRGYHDFLRMMYDVNCSTYYVDVPRAIPKKSLNQLFAAIETAKSGYSYDDRYEFKWRIRDVPKIAVMVNELPDLSTLSPDRWVFIIPSTNERLSYDEMIRRQEVDDRKNSKTTQVKLALKYGLISPSLLNADYHCQEDEKSSNIFKGKHYVHTRRHT